MQNAGQFGQGTASSAHPPSHFIPSEPSPTGGSTTTSLRQFRKKDVEKGQMDQPKSMPNSPVVRVPPHNHYPPTATSDGYRYQYQGFNNLVKYSEMDTASQNPITTSVIQKPKSKEYMDMCNMQSQSNQSQQQQQQHMPHFGHDNGQFMHKDPSQGYMIQSEQFFTKEQYHQYQPMPNQKFNQMMNQNIRKYSPTPTDNPFFNKLSKLHPSMARSIMSDHHLSDAQGGYPAMDQQRALYGQNRYFPGPMHQPSPYPSSPNYPINNSHPFTNYPPSSCNYSRPQMGPRYVERCISPGRRVYPEVGHINYHPMGQKLPPGHPHQYRAPEYAQHYQHRRMPSEYLQQSQFMQGHHQMPGQDMPDRQDNTVSPSDSLKKFLENFKVDEESTTEEPNIRDKLRDEAHAEDIVIINANDMQYLENNAIVTSESGFQLTSENYQYLVKSGIVEGSGVVRIIDPKEGESAQDRVVNLQILEAPPSKSDCMLANKKDSSKSETCERNEMIHESTVLKTNDIPLHQSVVDSLPSTKELVDKNCSPINMDQFNEPDNDSSTNPGEDLSQDSDQSPNSKSMPLIDFFEESNAEFLRGQDADSHDDEDADKDQPVAIERRKRIFSVDDIIGNVKKSMKMCDNHTIRQFIEKEVEFSSREQMASQPESMIKQENSREVLKVNSSTAVLQVGGELMEINVNIVNGQKVINVKPLTATTVVDCNANYEKNDNDNANNFLDVENACSEDNRVASPCFDNEVYENTATNNQSIKNEPVDASTISQAPVILESTPIAKLESPEETAMDLSSEDHTNCQPTEQETITDPIETDKPEDLQEDQERPRVIVSNCSVKHIEETPIEKPTEELQAEEIKVEEAEEVEIGILEDMVSSLNTSIETPCEIEPEISEDIFEDELIAEKEVDEAILFEEEETFNFPLEEDEVFLDEELEEVILMDPSQDVHVEEVLETVPSPEIPLELTQVKNIEPKEDFTTKVVKDVAEEPDIQEVMKRPKVKEVQILSPTSTNFEDCSKPIINDKVISSPTKASRKQYESDFQVQHDTVSSSKKEDGISPQKDVEKKPKRKVRPDKDRKVPVRFKRKSEACRTEDEDEYVSFKDLLKARKLKKLKKLQEESTQSVSKQPTIEANDSCAAQQNGTHDCCNKCGVSIKDVNRPPEEKKEIKTETNSEKVDDLKTPLNKDTPSPTSTRHLHPKDPRKQALSTNTASEKEVAVKKKISLADYVSRKRKATSSDTDEKKLKLDLSENVKEPIKVETKTPVIHWSDWEDTNSPPPPPEKLEDDCLIPDFCGLKMKPVIDIDELLPKDNIKDKTLQQYKDTVASKLSSLSIQIPKKPFDSTVKFDGELMDRFWNTAFLRNTEKLCDEDKPVTNGLSPSKSMQEVVLQLPEKKTKEESRDAKVHQKRMARSHQNYSVINRLGDNGIPKLIIKKMIDNTFIAQKQPVVALEKLNLNDLDRVKKRFNIKVRQ